MSEPLEFVLGEGDQVARLAASAWPKSTRVSRYKVEIMQRKGTLERDGAGVRFRVANGSAIYRVISESDDELVLLFVEGKLIWPG